MPSIPLEKADPARPASPLVEIVVPVHDEVRALPGSIRRLHERLVLVLAHREGLRIHEVPVDWVDDPDPRVVVVRTAPDDLRGIARLLAGAPLVRFLAIGVLSTLAHALLFLLLRGLLGPAGANAAALAVTAVGNTAANRRFSFRVRGRRGALRHQLQGGLVFALALVLTSGALAVLHLLDPAPARALELAVLVAANGCATVTRFVAMRTWIFARGGRRDLPTPPLPALAPADA